MAIALTALVLVVACGGGGDDDDGGGSGATKTPTTSRGEVASEPELLAHEMVDRYNQMNGELLGIINEDLPPEELAPKIDALKSKYIDIFVDIGYQREALSDDDVAKFNSAALSELYDGSPGERLAIVNDLLQELNDAGEYDLANEITSLNILTQYAQFELLWKQEPDEAERLALPSPLH